MVDADDSKYRRPSCRTGPWPDTCAVEAASGGAPVSGLPPSSVLTGMRGRSMTCCCSRRRSRSRGEGRGEGSFLFGASAVHAWGASSRCRASRRCAGSHRQGRPALGVLLRVWVTAPPGARWSRTSTRRRGRAGGAQSNSPASRRHAAPLTCGERSRARSVPEADGARASAHREARASKRRAVVPAAASRRGAPPGHRKVA